MATSTFTIGGVTVQAGDEVEATIKGTVKENQYGKDVYLTIDSSTYANEWFISPDHKVTVTKKAGPKEPTDFKTVARGTNSYGDIFLYVKSGPDKWQYVNSYGDTSYRTWGWLVNNFKDSKLEVLGATPSLPITHVVRDLDSSQSYKRTGGSTMSFRKLGWDNGFEVAGGNILTKPEAIALAWDILKVYGQVQ